MRIFSYPTLVTAHIYVNHLTTCQRITSLPPPAPFRLRNYALHFNEMAIDFLRCEPEEGATPAEEKYCLLQIKVCRFSLSCQKSDVRFLQLLIQAFRIEERTTPLPPHHLPASSEESFFTEGTDCLSDAFGNIPIMQKKVFHKAKMHCKATRREIGLECGLCSQGYRKEAKHERSKVRKSKVHLHHHAKDRP
jgi:hypothetical protein